MIRAYPADSTLLDTYTQFLDLVDLDAVAPAEITQLEMREAEVYLEGRVPGTWFNEAQLSLELEAPSILDEPLTFVARAEADWMKTDMVPFSASVSFSPQNTAALKQGIPVLLIIKKSNPSGRPTNKFSYTQPVRLNE